MRGVVAEIVGMDALMDDTPLMQSGLTSQSAAPCFKGLYSKSWKRLKVFGIGVQFVFKSFHHFISHHII